MSMIDRRQVCRVAIAAVAWPLSAAGASSNGQIPPELAELVPPGVKFLYEDDPAATANQYYRVGGKIPSGENYVVAYLGTRSFYFEQRADRYDDDRKAVLDLFKHYDAQVKRVGGKRLNTGVDTSSWMGVNAQVFLFSRPTSSGEMQFGLWIQDAGAHHWLMLFPQTDQRPPKADDLAKRLSGSGSAPLYIRFDTNKADLKEDGLAAVKEIVSLMRAHPEWRLSIEGHTDNIGTAEANLQLSNARARAVMQAVVAEGIDAKRLNAVGWGQARPVADNASDSGRARNRRVELVKAG